MLAIVNVVVAKTNVPEVLGSFFRETEACRKFSEFLKKDACLKFSGFLKKRSVPEVLGVP
jgi:hypothetical protein